MLVNKRWVAAALLALGSVWIGFEIGLDRHWMAGIFLFAIPALLLGAALASKEGKSMLKAEGHADTGLRKQVGELQLRLGRLEQRLEALEKAVDREHD